MSDDIKREIRRLQNLIGCYEDEHRVAIEHLAAVAAAVGRLEQAEKAIVMLDKPRHHDLSCSTCAAEDIRVERYRLRAEVTRLA